jgi:group I intron endonuclease
MKIKNLSRTPGIYLLENTVNGKKYVGSSSNIYNRCRSHKSSLRNNKHHNTHLQASFNKHGIDNFEFHVIEECEQGNKIEREQYWIDLVEPEYNIYSHVIKVPIRTEKHKCTTNYYLVSPEGEVFEGDNTEDFCRQKNLDGRVIGSVNIGNKFQYKGWTNSLENYQIIKKYGSLLNYQKEINNQHDFKVWQKGFYPNCDLSLKPIRETSISESGSLSLKKKYLLKKEKELIKSQITGIFKNPASPISFFVISPEGKMIEGTNLRQFCLDHDLNSVNMGKLLKGERPSCQGYTTSFQNYLILKYYGSFRSYTKSMKTPVKLQNIKTGKIEVVYNIKKFSEENQLNRSSIGSLMKGKLQTSQAWKNAN